VKGTIPLKSTTEQRHSHHFLFSQFNSIQLLLPSTKTLTLNQKSIANFSLFFLFLFQWLALMFKLKLLKATLLLQCNLSLLLNRLTLNLFSKGSFFQFSITLILFCLSIANWERSIPRKLKEIKPFGLILGINGFLLIELKLSFFF